MPSSKGTDASSNPTSKKVDSSTATTIASRRTGCGGAGWFMKPVTAAARARAPKACVGAAVSFERGGYRSYATEQTTGTWWRVDGVEVSPKAAGFKEAGSAGEACERARARRRQKHRNQLRKKALVRTRRMLSELYLQLLSALKTLNPQRFFCLQTGFGRNTEIH